MPNLSRAAVVAALLGLSLVRPAAQAPPPQPTFRTSTHYVAVDVVVTDRSDQPVTNLTRDDFEIVASGRRQAITDFAFVHVPLASRAIELDMPALPPGDVASNGDTARASRALVIFVDDPSLSMVLFCEGCPDVFVALKNALTRFLQSLSDDDQVAIVWQGRSDLSQDFTNDIPRLIDAVKNWKAAMGLTPVEIRTPWRATVRSLNFTINALEGSRVARRAIVYVGASACNPIDETYLQGAECRDLYRRAREANVPIYTLDPRVNPPSVSDNMAELSLNTGGLAFLGQSRPLAAVDRILADTGSFYTLGFYPDPLVNDGKYHEFKVNVRRDGVRVRARDRYLADKAVRPASTPNRDMTAALGAGVADPSIPVRAVAAPLAATARGVRTLVTIEVAYPAPVNREDWKDEMRVGILALSPDASIKASFQRPLTFTGQWKPTERATFVINETIDLPAEALTLRVGVTSKSLARTGTAHLRLQVPNLRGSRLVMTPLVLGTSSSESDAATGLDLVRELVTFQPTTQRTFSKTETLRIYTRAYWGGTADKLPFEIAIDDVAAPVQNFEAISSPNGSGKRRAALDTTVSLEALSPGPHVLTVTAKLGKEIVRREVPFEIK